MVALPISNIILKSLKPNNKPYPKELKSYGDYIRKHRLDNNHSQSEVAKIIGVETDTITNWELNRNQPMISYYPRIFSYLGYDPFKIESDELKDLVYEFRKQNGLSKKSFAQIVGVDSKVITDIEQDRLSSNKSLNRLMAIVL